MRQSLAAAGATPAQIAAVVAERGEAPPDVNEDEGKDEGTEEANAFAVEPDNWDTWQIFLAVSTQWVWAPMGPGGAARVALNHCALESGLRLMGIKRKRWPDVFADLRLIERAVLVADNEMRALRKERAAGK